MSKIEWTDETWNPTTGCTKVSPGCKHCYAERLFPRVYGRDRKFTDVQLHPSRLEKPLRWKKPRMVFVDSMSDLFHPDVPDEFIAQVFDTMRRCRQHTFQVLTKRPERLLPFLGEYMHGRMRHHSAAHQFVKHEMPNVWLGTSVENQQTADERIPHLLRCPAAVRFLSCEPLLSHADLGCAPRPDSWTVPPDDISDGVDPLRHERARIHWVIAGGEGGPQARPSHPDWFRSLRDQCVAAGVPFFFKQWGEWQNGSAAGAATLNATVLSNGRVICPDTKQARESVDKELGGRWNEFHPVVMARVGKKQAGRLLDGREWNEFPSTEVLENADSLT